MGNSELLKNSLAALDAAIKLVFSELPPDGLTKTIKITPTKTAPLGIGGCVGLQNAQPSLIIGHRVHALANVTIGGDSEAARDYIQLLNINTLSISRSELRGQGIFELENIVISDQAIQYRILFEYQYYPTVVESAIKQVDLAVENGFTAARAEFVWDLSTLSLAGMADPLTEFMVADDPDVDAESPASEWSYNPTTNCIEQNASVYGGPLESSSPKKAGAQLLWRPHGTALALDQFSIACEFESTSADGIGLVFHRQDDQNFCFFLASQHYLYHLFGRKVAGTYSLIGDIKTGIGFELGARHELKISSYRGRLVAMLDEEQTLAVDTAEKLWVGEAGFLTHGNDRARFYRARVIRLIQA
jgi:hypothetical protein